MQEPEEQALHHRVAMLEIQVAQLQQALAQVQGASEAPPVVEAAPEVEPATPPPVAERMIRLSAPKKDSVDKERAAIRTEDWISRIGIGLLLIGLAFALKLGIDRGWVTPVVRLAFGATLGAFLLGTGLRLRPKRLRLGQVLLGGGIATFYATIFAAYQFYSLVSYPIASVGMGVVTLLAFGLAMQQSDAVLAVIATLGGLGTPFLLYTDEGSIPGLMVYTTLVLVGSCGIYMYKGWRSLIWSAVIGGWSVMAIAWFDLLFDGGDFFADKTALQLGVLFCWAAFGILPVVRELLHRRDPHQWFVPELTIFKGMTFAETPAVVFAAVAPLVTLGFSRGLWDLPGLVWGLIVTVVAGAYVVAYAWLYRDEHLNLASACGFAAAVLMIPVWFDIFDREEVQMVAVALEMAALHALARRFKDGALRIIGHTLAIILATVVLGRFMETAGRVPVLLNADALANLAVIILMLSASWTFASRPLVVLYRITAYLGWLGWLWHDLVALPNGQAFVSVAWGVSAIVLIAFGWQKDQDLLRNTGLVTLLVVVGKLFVVDLARLSAPSRILLFLGFGGLLLLFSYLFPNLWKPDDEAVEEPAEIGG